MNLSARQIMTQLEASRYAPVYILQGEETYYIDWIAGYIETYALAPAERSFNLTTLYGRDADLATALTYARQFPVMASRRVVIVREAQDLTDIGRPTSAKLIGGYLAHPPASTILVFCYKHKTMDRRWLAGAHTDVAIATFKKLYDNQLPEFIHDYARSKGFRMEVAAVELLCQHVGNQLHSLASEIDKCLIGAAKGSSITADVAMRRVGVSREYNVFELRDALVRKDRAKAYRIAGYFDMHARQKPTIPVVAFLYAFYSRLLAVAAAPAGAAEKISERLGISAFAARDYTVALRRYSTVQIVECIHHIALADLALKGAQGALSEGAVLRELVCALTAD